MADLKYQDSIPTNQSTEMPTYTPEKVGTVVGDWSYTGQTPTAPLGWEKKTPSIITTKSAREATVNNQNYLNNTSQEPAPDQLSPITATSTNPQIQNTINTINEMVGKLNKNISPTTQNTVNNINNINALEKQSQVNAQTYAQNNQYKELNDEIQKLKDLRTQRDTEITNLYKEIQPLRQKYIEALTPTEKEQEIGTQLTDLRKKQADFELSLEQGQQQQFGLGRPLALSTGRAQELLRQGQFTKQDMRNQENLLLSRLGLEQDARKTQLEAYKTGLDFLGQDITLQQKIQDRLDNQENQLLSRVDKLDTQQRQQFADLLDIFKGSNPDSLSPEVQGQLAQLASQRGIPFDMVIGGLKTIYDKEMADLMYKQAQTKKVLGGASGGTEKEIIKDFSKSLADRNALNTAGTREQFIRQLIAQYPQIDDQSIKDYVYATYPDFYEGTKNQSAIDNYVKKVKSGDIDLSNVPADLRNEVAGKL